MSFPLTQHPPSQLFFKCNSQHLLGIYYKPHTVANLEITAVFLGGIYNLNQMLWDPLREDPTLDGKVRKSLKEPTSKLRHENVSEAQQQRLFQAERKA